MAQTPIYGIPYQTVNDQPNGPLLGQGIAETVEDELARIDGVLSGLPPILPGTCVARLRRSSSSTIAQGSAIPWDAEDWDDLDAHTSGSTRFQPTTPGRYLVVAVVRHQAVTAGAALFATIVRNGTDQASATVSANSSPSAGTGITVSDVVTLNGSSDFVEVRVGNNQATDVNCAGSVVTITYAGAA